jgi:hypothetical protein
MTLFFWVLMALLLEIYMGAVFFTEVVREHKLDNPDDDHTVLTNLFGSLPRSGLSLLQSVTGGKDWCEFSEALEEVGPSAQIPFFFFLLFTLLAMMNVITGAYLDTASENAKATEEHLALTKARQIFADCDHDFSGRISWKEFEKVIHHKRVEGFFKAMDLDASEGKNLFDMLDHSGDGSVSADEFLCGCLRLRGNARALDLLLLSRESQELSSAIEKTIQVNREAALAHSKVSKENQKVVKDLLKLNQEQSDTIGELQKMIRSLSSEALSSSH